MDLVTTLNANLDGRAIGSDLFAHREIDPFPEGFEINPPAGNILGVDPGTYGPCVTDGYWLMLSPLPAGQHTLNFDAVVDFGGGSTFTQDITYNITVVGRSASSAVDARGETFGSSMIHGFSQTRVIDDIESLLN